MSELIPPTFRSLSQHVRAALRNAIIDGTLQSGSRIVETQLASQFNTSRGPIREALRQLEAEGLVRSEPHRGTYIDIASPIAHIRELYSLRGVLEGLAARIVTAEHQDALPSLQTLVDELAAGADARDYGRILDADMQLHLRLCEASGHRLLNTTYLGIHTQIVGFSESILPTIPERVPHVAHSHQALVNVLASGDPDAAERAWRNHVAESAGRLIRVIERRNGQGGDI